MLVLDLFPSRLPVQAVGHFLLACLWRESQLFNYPLQRLFPPSVCSAGQNARWPARSSGRDVHPKGLTGDWSTSDWCRVLPPDPHSLANFAVNGILRVYLRTRVFLRVLHILIRRAPTCRSDIVEYEHLPGFWSSSRGVYGCHRYITARKRCVLDSVRPPMLHKRMIMIMSAWRAYRCCHGCDLPRCTAHLSLASGTLACPNKLGGIGGPRLGIVCMRSGGVGGTGRRLIPDLSLVGNRRVNRAVHMLTLSDQ